MEAVALIVTMVVLAGVTESKESDDRMEAILLRIEQRLDEKNAA